MRRGRLAGGPTLLLLNAVMKVHVLQHVPFEGIGSMEGWLAKRGATVGYTRFYESAKPVSYTHLTLPTNREV